MICVHRERPSSDFLGIKKCNWQAAACDLGAHAFLLYIYIASNRDNFNLALSPKAVNEAIGMARSTYHDQFHKLINKGYLVRSHGNTYDFFEKPQPDARFKNSVTSNGLDSETSTNDGKAEPQVVQMTSENNTEINNITALPYNDRTYRNERPFENTTEVSPIEEEFVF